MRVGDFFFSHSKDGESFHYILSLSVLYLWIVLVLILLCRCSWEGARCFLGLGKLVFWIPVELRF